MSNRAAKFVSAIVAGILAGANFTATATAENATKAADTCLSGPKGASPAGSHWYYRIDRATKRNCWYLGEDKAKTARAAPQQASPPIAAAPENPAPPQQNANVSKSIADARAEWPSAPARVEQDTSVNAQPQSGVAAEASQTAAAPDPGTHSSPIASRWPDSNGVSSSNDPRSAATDPAAGPQANAPAVPQPAATPVALAAADSSPVRPSGSIQMLLIVMAGALALAGVTASLIFRFSARPSLPRKGERRAIWDSIDADRSARPKLRHQDVPMWQADPAPDPRAADDPDRRITEMLSRLAKTAPG